VSQLLFLAIFVTLFIRTDYRGSDEIDAAVNAFFRADPLVLANVILAAREFTPLLLPAVAVTLATIVLGRFFCGWVCPLGTILDLLTPRGGKPGAPPLLRGDAPRWILLTLLVSSLFGVQYAGLLDPLAILTRGLTFVVYPLIGDAGRGVWRGLSVLGDGRDILEPAWRVIRDQLLPYRQTAWPLAPLSAAILFGIILLERVETRFWCRRLCPLGALLGILSTLSVIKRLPKRLCSDCGACATLCPTSFDQEILSTPECILCMECARHCPSRRVRFSLSPPWGGEERFLPQRRVLLGSLLGGFTLSRVVRFRSPDREARLLRPPGVRDERAFLDRCVRCGECMKVCVRSALYPALTQGGVESLYTPVVIPRLGYCEYNCTLCGQVCPTGAIPRLPVEAKRREVIGIAVVDRSHCLPHARKVDCIVCEEHCPIPTKAIRVKRVIETNDRGEEVELHQPFVVEDLCNGCGICEHVCPLEGKAAIEVFRGGKSPPIGS